MLRTKTIRPTRPLRSTLALIALAAALLADSTASARQVFSLDADWRFFRGDVANAAQPAFPDAQWQRVDLPHDWSIEGPFAETNSTRGAGGFLPAGIGWYRKTFTLSRKHAGHCCFAEFDGVMANSDVWINGRHLGKRPCGYVSFAYELTPHLKHDGTPNVLVVRADNSRQPASRWYAGAGIYRHVRLVVTDPVHVPQWATFASTPVVSADEATVHIESAVTNQSASARDVSVSLTLLDPAGARAARTTLPAQRLAPGESFAFGRDIRVKQPRLWDLENPESYRAVVQVRDNGAVLDEDVVPFGIREFRFDADTGFWLNGKNFKLYGVCLHHDGSAFGAAVPLDVWRTRLAALRELGANAVRTAHNPPAPEFLDLCDTMGFLVMDEFFDCWTVGKNPFDYHLFFREWSRTDARDTIRRDRNHPSIVLYSVGNEIHDTPKAALAKDILAGLVQVCHDTDPTRPVTQGLFRPNVSGDYTNGLADLLDVIGTNYRDRELLEAHRAKPTRKIVGTEQRHDRLTWLACRDYPQHAGQFLWTGIDYLGESRRWPIIAAGSGLLDRTGHPRHLGLERQSWWSAKPMVAITRRIAPRSDTPDDPGFAPLDRRQVFFPDWTPADLQPHDETVEVYSNGDTVELFLNGKSLGSKTLPANASPRVWTVPFEPGTLAAAAMRNGQIVARNELRTAGKPARIVLQTERRQLAPGWDHTAQVRAAIVDAAGVVVPRASDEVTFAVSGPGVIAAVDSADNTSHEPFQAAQRRAFQGRCVAWVKASAPRGTIHITASSPGLEPGSAEIQAAKD